MANMIPVKSILELHSTGLSQNTIARTRHISKSSVSSVISIAKEKNISYKEIADKSELEIYRLFYPDKFQSTILFENPDYEYVHKELSKTGVTLKLLWSEYKEETQKINKIPMGYTRFCEGYKNYTASKNLTSHIDHKPGQRCEVDWSGPTMHYIAPETGEKITVYLFVGNLPYSQYTYVEPTLDMQMKTWIRCHVHMYEFFEGVPTRTVCDNLKTGVVSHPKEGEIILTEDYEAMGIHYVTAIMPAGVRKPKQKASVEGSVGDIATTIIAKLRNDTFTSFESLKRAVALKVKEHNEAPFEKREGSRALCHQEEKAYLRPLPDIPYEIASWDRGHKVGRNFHITFQKNFYSVPYHYLGNKVDVRYTDKIVEIYTGTGERIGSHLRFPSYMTNKYSTKEEHMPPGFIRVEFDDERIRRWADSIGPYTKEVIDKLFATYKIKEQGYNPTLSVLRLSQKYSKERLENASKIALTKFKTPRYTHINALLSANQDLIEDTKLLAKAEESKGYLRGKDYYKGECK